MFECRHTNPHILQRENEQRRKMANSNFITFSDANKRLSDKYSEMREKAVEEINKLIKAAEELPVKIPMSLIPQIDSVRRELMRKLREEAGWHVQFVGDNTGVDFSKEVTADGAKYILLTGRRP
jgi:hypothetical protein